MERGTIINLPPIEHPTEEQLSYFLARAAFFDEVFENGGMTAEQAAYERKLTLARISMGNISPDNT